MTGRAKEHPPKQMFQDSGINGRAADHGTRRGSGLPTTMPLVGYNGGMSTELAVWTEQGREEAQEWSTGQAGGSELTPAQLVLRQMVLASVTSPHSRRNYAKALDLLFAFAAGRPLTRALLMEYRASMDALAPSTVNVRLAAIRKLVSEAARTACSRPRKPPI